MPSSCAISRCVRFGLASRRRRTLRSEGSVTGLTGYAAVFVQRLNIDPLARTVKPVRRSLQTIGRTRLEASTSEPRWLQRPCSDGLQPAGPTWPCDRSPRRGSQELSCQRSPAPWRDRTRRAALRFAAEDG